MTDDYNTAVHESGHAVFGHAIGLRIGSNGIAIGSSETGNAGDVWFHSLHGSNETFTALTIAGPMAETKHHMDTPDAPKFGVGWGKDVDDLCWIFTTGGITGKANDSLDLDTLAIDVEQIMTVLCLAHDTEEALEEIRDETPSAHFHAMAEAAETARTILNREWNTVLALAHHLVKVRTMSGEQLTAFLDAKTQATVAAERRTYEQTNRGR